MNRSIETQHIGAAKEGTVNFFSKPHGFGYINLKDTKENIFVHINNLIDIINANDKVIFDVIKGVKGLVATKVRLVRS
ncbi:MAG TPA: cold shock domain-containing protein [Aquaticitalea sp.]|nr:cold shock domain-containing protein [Aquaticitalea sp.]